MLLASGLLHVAGVVKRFGGTTALDGLTLSVEPGESLGIAGPNGCGKSTLVDVISGFIRPDAGRVWFAGREVTRWPPHRIVHAGIARTFQLPRLAPNLTVAQSLEAATLHRRLGRRSRRDVVAGVLEITELGDLRGRDACTLSLGERRRVEIGRALATGGQLLLLDEPLGSLTAVDAASALSVLRRLRGEGRTMLIAGHSIPLFLALCDRVVGMQAGQIVRAGRAVDVRDD